MHQNSAGSINKQGTNINTKNASNNKFKIIIISGMSGSGKSVALKCLEDLGYYCIDNLPPVLLTNLINYFVYTYNYHLAIAIDARSGTDFKHLTPIIAQLKQNYVVDTLFLNASDEILLRRFSETRRPHPLNLNFKQFNLSQIISSERQFLQPLQEMSYNIDTSNTQPNQLRDWITNFIQHKHDNNLLVSIQSFGFKHGSPQDADFLFDVRHLPNPYYEENLRNFTGLDTPIINFLSAYPQVQEQINDIANYFNKWLPQFKHRAYVNIGIGCTGGQHRSVYIVNQLTKLINHPSLILKHRNI